MKMEDDYTALAESLFRLINYRSSVQKKCAHLGDMECRLLNLLLTLDEPATMNSLAELLQVSHSRITRLVDGMLKKGLVVKERSREDGRSRRVRISREGENAGRDLSGVIRELQETLVSRLPADKIDEIHRNVKLYIHTFHEILEEKDTEMELTGAIIRRSSDENTGLIW